jgi:hypothetical protein
MTEDDAARQLEIWRSDMMCSRTKLTRTKLTAAVVLAVAMAVSQSVLGQTCPVTGCTLPGFTIPNGFTTCPTTGTNVHAGFPTGTTLCNNQPIDPATWVYGPNTDLSATQATANYWNPVAARMVAGLPVIGRRVSTATGYCGVAQYVADGVNANHFTWVDLRHSGLDNSQYWPLWNANACAGLTWTTTAARGALDSSIDEREAQHDGDGGAYVLIRPVESIRDAQEIVFWSFYPPFGHRSQGNTNTAAMPGGTLSPPPGGGLGNNTINGAGGYRNSFNRNAIMIAQIGTVAGAQAAPGIAVLDGIDALYLDEENLAFQSAGVADYNTLANGVRSAASANHKYLCTVDRTATPNVMTCLLNVNLSAAEIAKREPLRRLDANGNPLGWARLAGNSNGAN